MIFPPIILSFILANPQVLLERAEIHINESNWTEAAKTLDEYVRTENTPTAEAMYDRGIAHYNLGEFEIATQSFEEAMDAAQDPILQTFSAFNFGNAMYQQTLASLEGTGTGTPSSDAIIALEDAKTQIKQVLSSYRTAIANDKTDMDARANGELAWQMLLLLNQMQEQMEEQQEEEQDDEQQQEQEEKSADEQQENQDQNEEGSSEEEQQKQDSEQSEEQQTGEQTQEQQEGKQEQQNGEQSNQEQNQKQQNGEQSEEQQEGEQATQQEDDEQQEQESQVPLEGELETTDEQMNETKMPSTSLKDEGERLSVDEANRLLQLIRDKEQQRRKAIAARKAANRIPVGKDW
jgi:Ca-activated chloride channel family protein